MKAIAVLLLICISASAFAADVSLKNKLSSLLTIQAEATDAVDSALQLLKDLVQAERDEQTQHEAIHADEVEKGEAQINHLTDVRDQIRKECDNGHEHVKFIDDEIADTNSHLEWIAGRVNTLANQRAQFEDARCEANSIFIQTLREHQDAFEVIAFLREDLQNWQAGHSTQSLAQVHSVVDKLKIYSHLFEESALKEFVALGDPKSWEELTDGTTRREIDDAHFDNDREALTLDNFESGTTSRDLKGSLVDRINALLDKLEAHLQESLKNLQANEIKASFDLASWLDHADEELAELAADKARKEKYLEKLGIDRDVAQDYVDACEIRFNDAVSALQTAIEDLDAKRAWFKSETERRNSEIALLEECITIFKEKVDSMKGYLRERIEDYQPDQVFDKTSLRGVEF